MAKKEFTENELAYYEKIYEKYRKLSMHNGLTIDDNQVLNAIRIKISKMKNSALYDWLEYKRRYGYILDDDSLVKFREEYITNRDNKRDVLRRIEELYGKYMKICKALKDNILPRSLRGVLNDECSLLHLTLTNDEHPEVIRVGSLGSYMFLCQFHIEEHPSMQVNDYKGFVHCYGCGIQQDLIEYFMKIENLSFPEAVNLLAKIYMIDMKNEVYSNDNPLVIKYRRVLFSPEYKRLLEDNINKTVSKEINYDIEESIRKLNHNLETIDRIERGEPLKYLGKKPNSKRLILEKSFFNGE